MAISHLFEDFSVADSAKDTLKLVSEEDWEDHRLVAFEQGYSAGWEDAIAAQGKEQARAATALANSLEDLSFSYHEALEQMLGSLAPLFHGLVDTVFPAVMARTFGNHIVQQLQEMSAEIASGPVVLLVPKGAGSAVQPVMEREFPMPVKLIETPELEHGQALIRIGDTERQIDSDRLIAMIDEAVRAFAYQVTEETRHG